MIRRVLVCSFAWDNCRMRAGAAQEGWWVLGVGMRTKMVVGVGLCTDLVVWGWLVCEWKAGSNRGTC